MMEETVISYFSSDKILKNEGYTTNKQKQFTRRPKAIPRGGSAYFTVIEKNGVETGQRVDFYRGDMSS